MRILNVIKKYAILNVVMLAFYAPALPGAKMPEPVITYCPLSFIPFEFTKVEIKENAAIPVTLEEIHVSSCSATIVNHTNHPIDRVHIRFKGMDGQNHVVGGGIFAVSTSIAPYQKAEINLKKTEKVKDMGNFLKHIEVVNNLKKNHPNAEKIVFMIYKVENRKRQSLGLNMQPMRYPQPQAMCSYCGECRDFAQGDCGHPIIKNQCRQNGTCLSYYSCRCNVWECTYACKPASQCC